MTDSKKLVPTTDSELLAMLAKGDLTLPLPYSREILLLARHVAGTSYRDPREVEDELVPGVELVLRREPDNEHDPFAIRVHYSGVHLGYVPRASNEVLARLMDAGKQIFARIVNKEYHGDWLRLDIEIFLREA